ncbi:MAG: shikimate kinase [Salaquimonas sp.]
MARAVPQPIDKIKIQEALNGRSLVFVGMMGSGKTAIGKLVAAALDLPFFDSDHEIVAAANLDIPEIFASYGEEYFRSGEEKVIQRLLGSRSSVISLGGGAFVSQATRDEISKSAISIWLTADLDLLMSRVMRRPGTRPLLQTENPRATLAALKEKREPIYALADIHIPSSKISKNHTREAVIQQLSQFLLSQT